MAADDDGPGGLKPEQNYRSLPPGVRLDETIASVESDLCPTRTRGGTSTSIAP